jgi:predicted metal-dependent phosphoesterase TrpH
MVDLHSHSTASDGTLPPKELFNLAKSLGVRVLALTDHDTVDGIDEAIVSARNESIHCIPGVELEIDFPSGTFHLLGLGIDHTQPILLSLLKNLQETRLKRNLTILAKLNNLGIQCTWQEVLDVSTRGVVGRPHFARILVKKQIVPSVIDAFNQYLGYGMPLYEPKPGIPLDKAIEAIHNAGGISIIAHPNSLQLNQSVFTKRLVEWKALGLDGIETFHSGMSWKEGRKISTHCKTLGLLESGGSDFHDPEDTFRILGKTCTEKRSIPVMMIEPILNRLGINLTELIDSEG